MLWLFSEGFLWISSIVTSWSTLVMTQENDGVRVCGVVLELELRVSWLIVILSSMCCLKKLESFSELRVRDFY